MAVQTACMEVENKLENLHREVRIKTLELKNNVESQDEERMVSSKKVMELLCNVVDEIKKDLDQ